MHVWFPKKAGEIRPRSYVLPPKMRAAELTITAVAITVGIWKAGPTEDPDPSSLLLGSPVILAAPEVVDGVQVAAGEMFSQRLKGGVAGNQYVLTCEMTLSDLTTFTEDIVQPCTTYVPP